MATPEKVNKMGTNVCGENVGPAATDFKRRPGAAGALKPTAGGLLKTP